MAQPRREIDNYIRMARGHGFAFLSAPWGSPFHASVARLSVIGVWFVEIALTPYHRFAAFPAEMRIPWGAGKILMRLPATEGLVASELCLQGIRLGALVLLLAAATTRSLPPPISWILFLSILLLDTIAKMHGGFINHALAVPLFSLLVITIFGSHRYLSAQDILRHAMGDDRVRPLQTVDNIEQRSGTWLLAVGIVVPYSYVGLNRVLNGGLEVLTGDAILIYLATATKNFAVYPTTFQMQELEWLLKSGFAVLTLFEVSSFLVLWSSRFRMAWLSVILGFHLSTMVLMNVLFWQNMILASVVLAPCWRIGHYRVGDGRPTTTE